MKLLLIWLLGVPVAVTSMVTAQSLIESQHVLKSSGLSDISRIKLLGEYATSTKKD